LQLLSLPANPQLYLYIGCSMPAAQTKIYTAIILAGQRPGTDPLAAHFGAAYKVLIPFAGKAMLTHVVRAMHLSPHIGRIIVLGQDPAALQAAVDAGGGAEIQASNAGISTSLLALLKSDAASMPWLVTTGDHPLLTPQMVAEFVQHAGGDLSVAMVEKRVMLTQFPDAKRTWLRFSDGDWSGANLFAFHSAKVRGALNLWAQAESDRKKAWRLFMNFGPWLAIRAITRTIGLNDALARAGRNLDIDARLISLSDPVAAIDVDKIEDHILAESIFAQRTAAGQSDYHARDNT
jgi:GTP:adenosylcobinamide-phosphate guanylyltransferase